MEPLEVSLPRDLARLQHLRGVLSSWLDGAGVSDERRDRIVLAAHEAAANAIEHGGSGVTLTAHWVADAVELAIRNAGQWRRPRRLELERGRGLTVMRGLASDFEVTTDGGSTIVRLRFEL